MDLVKVCRDCGEEYRPEVLRCADCGGELEARYESERRSWPRPARQALPAADARPGGDYRPIAWSARAADLTSLADRLVEAGVPFYLRPREAAAGEGPVGYEIRVRQEEREAALRELEALTPAAPAPAREATSCPACGHALGPAAAECPDCGLALGESSD